MAPAFPAALTTPQPRRVSLPASAPPTPRPAHSTPVPHDLTTPRARARIARLRASEAAERYEDQAALLMTPAQFAALRRSFAGVKTEFADLDGMSWALAPGGTCMGASWADPSGTVSLKLCCRARTRHRAGEAPRMRPLAGRK
ncbi:hypothetical protein BC834DRAFT_845855 [Gloeopeniophorella convolvens]|nr:hypothetical protein BC834DRAFT_845855 [Gloeopeniophorella convolvens]